MLFTTRFLKINVIYSNDLKLSCAVRMMSCRVVTTRVFTRALVPSSFHGRHGVPIHVSSDHHGGSPFIGRGRKNG
jgi:hypothetical protein